MFRGDLNMVSHLRGVGGMKLDKNVLDRIWTSPYVIYMNILLRYNTYSLPSQYRYAFLVHIGGHGQSHLISIATVKRALKVFSYKTLAFK